MNHKVLGGLREEFKSLSVVELAELLGTKPCPIYQLVKSGDAPPSIKVGRIMKSPVSAVRQWFAEQANSSKKDDD